MDEVFVFKLLKILDNLQEYSKDSVIHEYDLCDDEVSQIILNKSVYPNGDQLGFYNYSQYNLEKLANVETINIKEEFIDYIDSFSENIYDYLDSLNIEDIRCYRMRNYINVHSPNFRQRPRRFYRLLRYH